VPKVLRNRPKHIVNLEAVQALVGDGTNRDLADEMGISVNHYVQMKSSGRPIPSRFLLRLVELSCNRFDVKDFLPDA